MRRQGAEISATLLGGAEAELGGSLTMSRNKYRDYVIDSVHYGRPGQFADYAGNRVAGVPGLFYSARAGRNLGDALPLRIAATVRGVGGEPVAFEPGAPRSLIVSVSIGSNPR